MRGFIFTIGALAIAVALVGGCQNETPIESGLQRLLDTALWL